MIGMDRHTGQPISGLDHLLQSIEDILTTPLGSRLMRPEYLIPRNAVQHNRPLHVPLLGSVNQMGNAADGEQWYMDACYMLWRITGEARYKKAMAACRFTAHEYTQIDSSDRFFRQSRTELTPYTDGIAYQFSYPSDAAPAINRDSMGYITIDCDEAAQVSLEQQAVWFRISKDSLVRTCYGGVDTFNAPLNAKVDLVVSPSKAEGSGIRYSCALPKSVSNIEVVTHDIPLSSFTRLSKDDGSEYIMADLRAVSHSDDIVSEEGYEPGIFEGRGGNAVSSFFPTDDGWYSVGHWLLPTEKAPLQSITYRADGNFNLRIVDDDGWRWWWMLPATEGAWVTLVIRAENATLSGYQPGAADRPEPNAPVYTELDGFSVLMDDSSDTNLTFSYYCINDVPPAFAAEDGYNNLKNWIEKIGSGEVVKAYSKAGIDYQGSLNTGIQGGQSTLEASFALAKRYIEATDPKKAAKMAEATAQISKEANPEKAKAMLSSLEQALRTGDIFADMQVKSALTAYVQNKALYEQLKNEAAGASGILDKNLSERRDTSSQKWSETIQAGNDAMRSVGDAIRPVTDAVATGLTTVVKGITKLSDESPKLVMGLTALATGASVVTSLLGAFKIGRGLVNLARGGLGGGGGAGRAGVQSVFVTNAKDALGGADGGDEKGDRCCFRVGDAAGHWPDGWGKAAAGHARYQRRTGQGGCGGRGLQPSHPRCLADRAAAGGAGRTGYPGKKCDQPDCRQDQSRAGQHPADQHLCYRHHPGRGGGEAVPPLADPAAAQA